MLRYVLGLNALGGGCLAPFAETSEESIILAGSLGLMDRTLESSNLPRGTQINFTGTAFVAFHTRYSGWRGSIHRARLQRVNTVVPVFSFCQR